MSIMLFQTLYFLVDLYFVAHIGGAAIAGVSAAGNLTFVVMALTQVLGVGTVTLIAQAAGRKDHDDANLVFNQSLLIATLCAAITVVGGYFSIGPYMLPTGANDSGGTCYGDSGGPHFVHQDGVETDIVVAITITGDAQCKALDRDYRVDTANARDFLGQYVTLP